MERVGGAILGIVFTAFGVLAVVSTHSGGFRGSEAYGYLIAGLCLFFGAALLWASRTGRPYRLYTEGIELPGGTFWPYRDTADAHLCPSRKSRQLKFLVLTRTDGLRIVIGEPMTRNITFAARDFKKVADLILSGVRKHGHRSRVSYSPEALAVIDWLGASRGRAFVETEKAAEMAGIKNVDGRFLEEAARDGQLPWDLARALKRGLRELRKEWA